LCRCLVASSIKEALEKIKPVAAELEKLARWEKEGKIESFGNVDSHGFLNIKLNDDSIGPELRSMKLVLVQEFDELFDDEECHPELSTDESKEDKKQKEGK